MSQTWTIAKGVFVGSGTNYGVFNTYDGGKLINNGHVYSADTYGVIFEGNNSTIVNKAGASIFGTDGVSTQDQHETLINHGSIIGYTGYGVNAGDTGHFKLQNDGEIYGLAVGVIVQSVPGFVGPTIDNSGLINSDQYGIYVGTGVGTTTTVVNEHGGTIGGSSWSVYAASGKLSLENHGTIKGAVVSNAVGAHDKVVNDGTIKGYVDLGPADDLYRNAGGKAGFVFGGDGNDTLIAGPHADKFVFDTAPNEATNLDTIKHFDPGTDEFFLSPAIFSMLTGWER